MTTRLLCLLLLLPTPALAQLRPGTFTTLTVTGITSDALHVGCAVGSSTCTGGIKAGALLLTADTTLKSGNIALTCDGATINQNVAISSLTVVRFTTAGGAACPLGGIAGGVDGRLVIILNATGQSITISFDAAGSTAGNRIATPGAGTLTFDSGTMGMFVYDGTTARWRPFKSVG